MTPRKPTVTDLVPHALACARCRYDLSGLGPRGGCPECGFPIERSLAGDGLRFADPAHVRRLWLGACMLEGWLLCFFPGVPLAAGPLAALALLHDFVSVLLIAALITAWSLLGIAGVFWLTSPDPEGSRRSGFIRWTARGSAAFLGALWLPVLVYWLDAAAASWIERIIPLLTVAMVIVAVCCHLSVLVHASSLIRRLGDRDLRRKSKRALRHHPAAAAVLLICVVLIATGRDLWIAVGLLGFLTIPIWWWFLTGSLTDSLRTALRIEQWAAEGAQSYPLGGAPAGGSEVDSHQHAHPS